MSMEVMIGFRVYLWAPMDIGHPTKLIDLKRHAKDPVQLAAHFVLVIAL